MKAKCHDLIVRMEKQEGQIFELQQKLDSTEHQNTILKTRSEGQQNLIKKLQLEQNDQEQYSRRNCIRVFGVPESPQEDTTTTICKIAQEKLHITLKPEDIDRSHRVRRRNPPPHPGSRPKPAAIIVKLTSYQHRQRLIVNRKNLKGSGISICEDLTDANRTLLHDAFIASKKLNSKIEAAWSMDGRIIVSVKASHGKSIRKQIHDKNELDNI